MTAATNGTDIQVPVCELYWDWLLVRVEEADPEKQTSGGIFLPEAMEGKATHVVGEVMGVGPGMPLENDESLRVRPRSEIGDRIWFAEKFAVSWGEDRLVMVKERDCVCKLHKDAKTGVPTTKFDITKMPRQ